MVSWKLLLIVLLKLDSAISKAETYLVKMVKQTVCTYGLAIAVYSLYLSPTTPSSEMKNTLKSRIQDSEECEKMDCIDVMNCVSNNSLNSIILEAVSHSYILYSYITLLYSTCLESMSFNDVFYVYMHVAKKKKCCGHLKWYHAFQVCNGRY